MDADLKTLLTKQEAQEALTAMQASATEFAACILSTGHNIQKLYRESAEQQGVMGYIVRSAIDAILSGEQTELSDAVFVYGLTPGEGAENGIAASKDDAVILTNQNCYLLRTNNGVEAVWCTPYESVGAKVSGEGDKTTGGGLAFTCCPMRAISLSSMFPVNRTVQTLENVLQYKDFFPHTQTRIWRSSRHTAISALS